MNLPLNSYKDEQYVLQAEDAAPHLSYIFPLTDSKFPGFIAAAFLYIVTVYQVCFLSQKPEHH